MPSSPTPSNPTPNCAITLYYYPGKPAENVPSRFSYYCTGYSLGWTVQSDGNLHAPSRNRVVQISLDAYPFNFNAPHEFAGFRMGLMNAALPMDRDTNWTPKGDLEKNFGVKMLTPRYPTRKSKTWRTLGPLIFDMTAATDRLVYTLAVSIGDSAPDWDDPKIYDDGSQ